MKTLALVILLFSGVQAYATKQHCEPKPREPASKPEPKAESRPARTPSDHDRPCDRTIGAPVWCKVLK